MKEWLILPNFDWKIFLIGIALVAVGWLLKTNRNTQSQKLKIGGDAKAPITQNMSNTNNEGAGGGGMLSFLADILQVIGFAITVLQLFKVIPAN